MNLSNKKIILIIAGLLLMIIILSFTVSAIRNRLNNNNSQTAETPEALVSPTPVINKELLQNYKSIDKAPRLLPREGKGLDINAPYIQSSILEIEKVSALLPYSKSFTSSKNIKVEIQIPPAEMLDNNWTLLVQIMGIDYQVPEDDPSYNDMKISFLQGAQDVFYWLKNNNINTENIIIQWGDRAFVQDRSAEWLQN